LLYSWLDPNFVPGTTSNHRLIPNWSEATSKLAESFQSAFPGTVERLVSDNERHVGWVSREDPRTLNAIVHPLWNTDTSAETHPIALLMRTAADNGLHYVRFIDSFNLQKRAVWVRQNISNLEARLVVSPDEPRPDAPILWRGVLFERYGEKRLDEVTEEGTYLARDEEGASVCVLRNADGRIKLIPGPWLEPLERSRYTSFARKKN
jgi:hypothetical protein